MPTLNWIGKEKVINHHQDVPYRILEEQYTFNKDEGASENKIIHGDNLEALKSLLPEYEGKIKCIYIDPPYNTGNEGWVYNDNVSHPKLKKWLGQVVGKESEDLSRHDKWLCMMYPRLKLLHKLLADDGVIFMSIDDNELSHLKIMCDEIFGRNSFIEYFSWKKTSTAPSLANKSRKTVEYILCYEKRKSSKKYNAELSDGGDAPLLNSGNPLGKITFPKEKLYFKLDDGTYAKGQYEKVYLHNDIVIKNGLSNVDIELSGTFKWIESTVKNEIQNGTTFIIKSDKFSVRFLRKNISYKAPTNQLKEKYYTPTIDKDHQSVETNETAKKILKQIFNKDVFEYSKPHTLIEFFLKISTDKNSIILDSFAGSGTTAHAVLNLNKQDGGNRKCILIEMEEYANDITAERVKRVIKGYGEGKKAVEGTGGDFTFYELGKPLFKEDKLLNEEVALDKILEYVWYSETKSSFLPQQEDYLLGTKNDTAYYFYYEKERLTTLNESYLRTLKTKASQYIIYADLCLLDQNLMDKYHIVFKKIPRDISRF